MLDGRWWHYTAGCFFAIYVVSITFVAPKIGLGNAIILVVVAQIFTAEELEGAIVKTAYEFLLGSIRDHQ